jgi:hypothetical protein
MFQVGNLIMDLIMTYYANILSRNLTAGSNSSALPSKEVPGGSGVGVGSLPGPNSEAGVAKLPQERANEGTLGPNAQGWFLQLSPNSLN